MRKTNPLLPATVLLAIVAIAPAFADESGARIALLGGESHRGVRIVAVTGNTLAFETADGESRVVDLDRLIGISLRDARPQSGPAGRRDVEALLRGGDILRGTLLPGEDEELLVESPYIGEISLPVDEVKELRFSRAWAEAAERPAPRSSEQDLDVFYYRNLDHVSGTFLRATSGHVHIHGSSRQDLPVSFESLLAIRFADFPAPEGDGERTAILLLEDGSRITVSDLTATSKELRAVTQRGRRIEVELRYLTAIYMRGGKFEYLSDLEPSSVKIVPWIGEAHAWDRPRFDRSFMDGPIRSGGQTFLKGIGVISGTSLTFPLDGSFRQFTSRIALDDQAGTEGDVTFEVLVDGQSKFKSKTVELLHAGEEPQRIRPIDVSGAKELTLVVHYVDDSVRDFANWIEPMLIR